MKKIIAFLLILGFASSSCEPDDICDPNTPTTPRMLIQFYDNSIPTLAKKVINLKVIGEGMAEGVILNPTGIDDSQYVTSATSILLPLNTEANTVKYKFILNYGNSNAALVNEDNLEFTYTGERIFVSRACGYKIIFNLADNTPFKLTDKTTTANNPVEGLWIKNILVEQRKITSENETIVKIFF